ncbi:MAG: hypothetical protein CMJ42_08305 [Phyllobacteriaceae bacterium]|nr:hypothetical protein [Phyllobacteriaceae bacterium]MBA89768.1 hypothetical protein [Phyllobacteriaceae bacterium]
MVISGDGTTVVQIAWTTVVQIDRPSIWTTVVQIETDLRKVNVGWNRCRQGWPDRPGSYNLGAASSPSHFYAQDSKRCIIVDFAADRLLRTCASTCCEVSVTSGDGARLPIDDLLRDSDKPKALSRTLYQLHCDIVPSIKDIEAFL